MKLNHQYQSLGTAFSQPTRPEQVESPSLLLWNKALANELNIDINKIDAAQIFSGNELVNGSKPIAMAYSGHQFGQFNPHLGDGRAHLLGELDDVNGKLQEIQLKGSGRTPFSRNGDGKCGIKPAVREYIMSEALHALNVPTTRCLSVVTTGEDVYRQTSTPGAVVARVATSHLRVGTFEYFAARDMHEELRVLADLAISRHYSQIRLTDEIKYIKLISYVIDKQIDLIVEWQRIGFIHGVMNTDNTLLSGATIDYGPCAMMGVYDPSTVFSSIDRQGRYAFGNQPWIGQWNMARFAESLIPIVADGGDEAIKMVTPMIESYEAKYQLAFNHMMARKIGFDTFYPSLLNLINELLDTMFKKQLDYTQTFVLLQTALQLNQAKLEDTPELLSNWYQKWLQALSQQKQKTATAVSLMTTNNPLVIPRNHHVERILQQVESNLKTDQIHAFMQVLQQPYNMTESTVFFQDTAANEDLNYQTFCGT